MLIRKPALMLVAFAFIMSATLIPFVSAQNATQQTGGSGLQLSPTRTELNAQPGEQKTFSIILKNITQADVTAKVFLNDFESDGQSGTPQIVVDEKRERSPYTLNKMLRDLADVDLKANETKEIKLTVDVPVDTAPGAYFGAVRYASLPKGQELTEAQRQVALTASVAHLVFVEIPGDVNEQIQIQRLEATRDGKGGKFFFKAPGQSSATVKNLGNGFSRPFGQVELKNMTGKEVAKYELNNTEPKGIILPNSSRTFTDDISNIKIPGKYTLSASVAYGNGGEVVTYKSSFWYLPIWFVIIFVVLLGALITGSYVLYKKKFAKTTKRR